MTSYEKLINAIIKQAALDYRSAYNQRQKLLKSEPPDRDREEAKIKNNKTKHEKWEFRMQSCEDEMRRIKGFFYSDWFETLYDVNGPAIFRVLKNRTEEEAKK